MSYDALGPGPLDYLPCQYGTSKLTFRGPMRDLEAPYVAFIGGTQTFGKFIEQPYPLKVEHLTGVQSVNLGQVNAGLDVFAKEAAVQEAAQGARVTVLEVLGAANMSNLFYAVHPRRNDRFLRAQEHLGRLYPDVDFAQFNFTQHMLSHLHDTDAERFELIKRGLQRAWVRKMRHLLAKLGDNVVLLHLDAQTQNHGNYGGAGCGAAFVTNEMLALLDPVVKSVVRVAAKQSTDMHGMAFNLLEEEAAGAVSGPQTHTEAAEALLPVLDSLM